MRGVLSPDERARMASAIAQSEGEPGATRLKALDYLDRRDAESPADQGRADELFEALTGAPPVTTAPVTVPVTAPVTGKKDHVGCWPDPCTAPGPSGGRCNKCRVRKRRAKPKLVAI